MCVCVVVVGGGGGGGGGRKMMKQSKRKIKTLLTHFKSEQKMVKELNSLCNNLLFFVNI
jgi:hypothetical protein